MDDLFIGVFPAGISYCDRSRERNGDHLKVAFLLFHGPELVWRADCSPAMREAILDDAAERFPHVRVAVSDRRQPVENLSYWDQDKPSLEEILAKIKAGHTLYVCTGAHATKIRQRDVERWNAAGKPLLKAKGKSLYMGAGRQYLCIDFCGLQFTD